MQTQPALIRTFVANARRHGASIYAGKSFAVARWEDKVLELRVDRKREGAYGNR